MDSNLITLSSILQQTNIYGSNTRSLDTGKDGPRFFVKPDYDSIKIKTPDKKAETELLKENKRFSENLSISQKLQDNRKCDKSRNTNNPEENTDKNYTYSEYRSPVESSESRENRNVEPKSASEPSELKNQSEDAKTEEITQFQQKDENHARLRELMSEQSGGKFGFRIYSTNVNGNTINTQADGHIENIENTSILDELTDLSKTIIGGIKSTISKTEVGIKESATQSTDGKTNKEIQTSILGIKESIVGNKGKSSIIDVKVPLMENDLIKDNAKTLISQTKIDENGIKETLLTDKNLDNNKQSSVAQGIAESSKIRESMPFLNGLKGDSAAQKVDITNLQVSAGQTKSNSDLSQDNKTNSGISQIASYNNTFVTEQNVSSIANVKVGNQTQQGISEDVSANVGKQIFESIHSSIAQRGGDKQITVNLNPPELGQVSIKFQEQDAQLIGLLEVSKTQTRSEIEQALPQIVRNLSDSGINIKRLEVVLTTGEQTEREATREDSLFYNQQQQNFNNPSLYEGSRDMTGFHEWMASNISSVKSPSLGDSLTVENSINILI